MITKNDALKLNVEILQDSQSDKERLTNFLKENFPSTFKDGEFSISGVLAILGLDKSVSGYELNWTGKALSHALYQVQSNKDLILESGKTNAQNQIIIGDNLDALKILKSAYDSKIKMIYIDPPYNTKNENFIYPDDFRKDYKDILKDLDLIEVDDDGNEVESESLNFIKNIQGSRSHSGWLSFIYPRLKLARDLLRDDGVIFISIDDNEMANLKLLCDEIFGEDNFVENFIWVKNSTKNLSKTTSTNHEYILCYAKNISEVESVSEMFRIKKPGFDEVNTILKKATDEKWSREKTQNEILEFYKNNKHLKGIKGYSNVEFRDGKFRVYTADNLGAPLSTGKAATYEVLHPVTKKPCKIPNRGWVWTKEKMYKMIADDLIEFYDTHERIPRSKRFLDTVSSDVVKSLIVDNTDGKKELARVFGECPFDNPKPTTLIKYFIEMSTSNNDIILDFFAGSGTTAHAVIEQNLADNGNRKFILVQLDEKIDEKKSKTAYDFCKDELKSKSPVISDITIERVKRAIKNLKSSAEVSVFKMIDKPNLTLENGTIELHLSNLTPFDIARNLLLICGKTLDKELKEIIKDRLFICDEILVIVKSDEAVVEKLKEFESCEVVLNGYADINFDDFANIKVIVGDRLKVVF
ncbi:site-specific DNA-methyltransferase [Campylobacter corcagiensis]|uniref:site-specific DNA-methyltransferase (adenine-specific) n=1 Tax=Campylobacter corcagiensis TaxID=1448857 RepID=A0A7M1LEN2_9BACT|nr:site-specific DNA-methyltransferase [Campylobacter corcagiensis]QKF64806.1 type III restriction/modification system, modification subunit [Campylobacter corcagiensis]QOQ87032.1 site-specific DNA-methyltransferase [Campylobacter corcagiensis]